MRPIDYQLLAALADAIVSADHHDRIVFVNPAAERLLGWKAGDLVGQPLTTIMPERMRGAHAVGFNRYFKTHEKRIMGRPVRVPALRADGAEIDIELALATVAIAPGEEIVIASLRDLRDRVELERQLTVSRYMRAATQAAARLSSRLDLAFALATVVDTLTADFDAVLARVWLMRPGSTILDLRASAGISTETERSRRAHIDVATHPSKVGQVARTQRPFIKNGLAGDLQFDADFVARERVMAVAVLPLVIGGEVRGVMASFHRRALSDEVVDVLGTFAAMVASTINDAQLFAREQAARAEAEQAKAGHARLQREAEEAVRARDAFLSIASHELRTPTTALALRAQGLERHLKKSGDPAVREELAAVQIINRQIVRLNLLVDTLLDVSRITSHRLVVDLESVDLSQLVRDVGARLVEELDRAHCLLELRAEVAAVGRWDRARLDQVVMNLLMNAIKYGRGKPVTVTVDVAGPEARLVLQDRGIGIAADDQARIFERFERAVSDRHYGGFGIGLWIVRQIVSALGGTISVESSPGQGSTFTVRLPLAGPPAGPPEGEPAPA